MARKLSDVTIQKIREDVSEGKSKYKIARDCGISANAVYNYTKSISSNKTNVFGKTIFINNC